MLLKRKLSLIIGGACLLSMAGCSSMSSRDLVITDLMHDGADVYHIDGKIRDGGPADPHFIDADSNYKRLLVRVYEGDTFFGILARVGANKNVVNKLPKSDQKKLTNIYPNDIIELTINKKTKDVISLAKTEMGNTSEWITAEKTRSGYKVSEKTFKATYQEMYAQGTVRKNFYVSGAELGIDRPVLRSFVDLMGKQVDINKSALNGDSFQIAYRQMQLDNKPVGEPIIIGAKYVRNGTAYEAYRYVDKTGYVGYYDSYGHNYEKGFLKSPVKYTRVSSKFDLHRLHPRLRIVRPHKGVDLAAPTNTIVKAPSNGKVSFVGVKGGYGNVVEIKHPGNITTIYAHLHKFGKGLRVGNEVKQGETIAYVGSTGLSTGPHLHYEIRINGKPVDPMKTKIANITNLNGSALASFKESIKPFTQNMAKLDKKDMKEYTYQWNMNNKNLGI